MSRVSERVAVCSYTFGAWMLQRDGLLLRGSEEFYLPPKELEVLRVLLQSEGALITKQYLLDNVWGGGEASDESLARCIYVLRKVLGNDTRYIKNVYGRGYCFAVEVIQSEEVAIPELPAPSVPSLLLLPFLLSGEGCTFALHGEMVRQLAHEFGEGLCVMPARLTGAINSVDDWLKVLQCAKPDYYLSLHCVVDGGGWTVSVELVRSLDHALLHSVTRSNLKEYDAVCRLIIRMLVLHLPGLMLTSSSYDFLPWDCTKDRGPQKIFLTDPLARELRGSR